MKRYKDCSLICNDNQQPIELLELVMKVSQRKGYKVERYSTMLPNDTIAVFTKEEDLPSSRLIICTVEESHCVSIVNIVPNSESGIFHIECGEYNLILDSYKDKVFVSINESFGNQIDENSEDYNLEELIPFSFPALKSWLNMYPLSGHSDDEKRWFAFVVALHVNKEELSLSDFEKYLEENYGWAEKVIESFSIKLSSQLELLEYYDTHR